MANERLITVSLGPLQGRVMLIEAALDNLQSLMRTIELEVRDADDEVLEGFILHILQLSGTQFTYATESLTLLKDLLNAGVPSASSAPEPPDKITEKVA